MSISSSGGKLHEAMFLVNEWTSEQKGAWLSPFGDQFWSLEEPTDGQTEMRVKGLGLPTSWWRVPHMWSICEDSGQVQKAPCGWVLREETQYRLSSLQLRVYALWSRYVGSRYFEKGDDLYRQTLQIILEHFSSITWETTEGCEWLFLFISFYF